MNLYRVYPRGGDWCCFVFEETRNKARASLVGFFDNNEEYIDFDARLVAKDTGGEAQVCDVNCARLEQFGAGYREEDYF